jgi:cyclic pyranopterin phosphate synthase
VSNDLPHLTAEGDVHMVDVGGKPETDREAIAEAVVSLSPPTAERLFSGDLPKGDALATVRIAAIAGAKRAPDLVPLCHPVALTGVTVAVERHPDGARIEVSARTTGRTGVEMEALTGATAGALALYDMVKGLERGATIGPVRLLAKSGGRSGDWRR